jgi:hypothetical protein
MYVCRHVPINIAALGLAQTHDYCQVRDTLRHFKTLRSLLGHYYLPSSHRMRLDAASVMHLETLVAYCIKLGARVQVVGGVERVKIEGQQLRDEGRGDDEQT